MLLNIGEQKQLNTPLWWALLWLFPVHCKDRCIILSVTLNTEMFSLEAFYLFPWYYSPKMSLDIEYVK